MCHNTIPEEIWTQKHQNIAHLCPFESIAFAKVPEELIRSKLDPYLVKYILVGYAGVGGYRLYDKATRSIIIFCDVIFDEGTGHYSLMIVDATDNLVVTEPPAPVLISTSGIITPR